VRAKASTASHSASVYADGNLAQLTVAGHPSGGAEPFERTWYEAPAHKGSNTELPGGEKATDSDHRHVMVVVLGVVGHRVSVLTDPIAHSLALEWQRIA